MNVPPGGAPRHAMPETEPTRNPEVALLDGLNMPFATHPLEIAAALEASGCRDVDAREIGWPDTFALAEHLFAQQVMHRLAEGEPIVELAEADAAGGRRQEKDYEATERHLESQLGMRPQWHVLLKGVLFSLPGLVLAGAMPFPLLRSEAVILMATLALSWGLGQGVSFGGYMRVSVSPADARRHMVPWVVGHASVMALALGAVVVAGAARPLVGLIAFTQAIYLISASGLMVLGRERVLYLLLAVGSIAGVQRVIPPVDPEPAPWAAALALASMGSATVILLWSCRPSARVRTGSGSPPVPKASLVGHVFYGLTTAALVLWLPWYGGIGLGLTFLMAPVVLSLGLIEWLLLWLRGVGRRDLALSEDLASFRDRVTRSLRVAGAVYFAVLVTMVVASIILVEQVLPNTSLADHAEVPASIVALGMYLFFAAVAVALFGLRFLLPAALVAVLVLAVAPLAVTGWHLALIYGVVCLGLVLVAYRVALRQVRIPGNLT